MNYINSPSNIEDLRPLVEEEIKLIKQHFAQEEIDNLDIDTLDTDTTDECIYGQMVGDCNSPLVHDFIKKHLSTVIISSRFKDEESVKPSERAIYYITPLEEYIYPTYEEKFADELPERVKWVINELKDENPQILQSN